MRLVLVLPVTLITRYRLAVPDSAETPDAALVALVHRVISEPMRISLAVADRRPERAAR